MHEVKNLRHISL